MAANRAKKKQINEEKKRKEEADVIKQDTASVKTKDEPKSEIISAATTKKKSSPDTANNKGKVRQYVKSTPPTYPEKTEAKTEQSKPVTSFSSLKKPTETPSQNTAKTVVYERKDTPPVTKSPYIQPNQKDKAAIDASKKGSVTGAGVKTREWVRDE